jgi:hypothetical protein
MTGKLGAGGELHKQATNWPTAGANDYKGTAREGQLDEAAEQIWMTPAADSFRSRGGDRKHEMGLDQQARSEMWTTPRAITGGAESAERKQELGRTQSGGGDLQSQCETFPTPRPGPATSNAGEPSSNHSRSLRRRLNPLFVEWLMGFPFGWTVLRPPHTQRHRMVYYFRLMLTGASDYKPLAMPSSRRAGSGSGGKS